MIDPRLDVMYNEMGVMKNTLSDMIEDIEYLNTRVDDLNDYIKFINIDESISYDKWFEIRGDEEELIKLKRNITINEIIK